MIECMPSMHGDLGTVPRIKKKEKREKFKKQMKRRVGFVTKKLGKWDKTVVAKSLVQIGNLCGYHVFKPDEV